MTRKLIFSVLTAVISLAAFTVAQDGQSGDGGCNPCDETCNIFSRRGEVFIPRMLEANESSLPWEEGEGYRWTKPAADSEDPSAILTLTFNCGTLPEICNNICYGLFCGKNLPSTLTIDRTGCPAARKANACGATNPNYCSVKKGFAAGYSCDEYPFASTKEGGKAVTRCVPKGQNSSQGGQISGLYTHGQGTGKLADGTKFNVGLSATAGTTGYCKSYPSHPNPNNCQSFVGDPHSGPSQR